jgi:hypothetical protein
MASRSACPWGDRSGPFVTADPTATSPAEMAPLEIPKAGVVVVQTVLVAPGARVATSARGEMTALALVEPWARAVPVEPWGREAPAPRARWVSLIRVAEAAASAPWAQDVVERDHLVQPALVTRRRDRGHPSPLTEHRDWAAQRSAAPRDRGRRWTELVRAWLRLPPPVGLSARSRSGRAAAPPRPGRPRRPPSRRPTDGRPDAPSLICCSTPRGPHRPTLGARDVRVKSVAAIAAGR